MIGAFSYLGACIADRYQVGPGIVGFSYLAVGLGVLAGDILSATTMLPLPLRFLTAMTGAASGLVLAAALALPMALPTMLALTAGSSVLGAMSYIALTTLLTRQTPGGAGTTMVLNGSVINLGTALGAAVGGLLIALGGYALLGLLVPICVLGACTLVLLLPDDAAEPFRSGLGSGSDYGKSAQRGEPRCWR